MDTASGYGNQVGVGEAVRQLGRENVFITTKIPPCSVAKMGSTEACSNSTAASIASDIAELNIGVIDLMLLHGPVSSPSAGKGMASRKPKKNRDTFVDLI